MLGSRTLQTEGLAMTSCAHEQKVQLTWIKADHRTDQSTIDSIWNGFQVKPRTAEEKALSV